MKRIATYTLAGLSACALMITTADATGRADSAKIKPRTSAQKHSKPPSPRPGRERPLAHGTAAALRPAVSLSRETPTSEG